MLIVTMLKFDCHHCLEAFYGLADGLIEYLINHVKGFADEGYTFALCRILHTLAQDIVFGDDLGNVETCLPAEQAVFCGNGICLAIFISDIEGFGKIVEKLRYFIIDSRRIEAGRAGKISHLLAPATE